MSDTAGHGCRGGDRYAEDTLIKSPSFGVMHPGIAFSVAIAGAITFVEPLVSTVAHDFFDRHWDHPRATRVRSRLGLGEDRLRG